MIILAALGRVLSYKPGARASSAPKGKSAISYTLPKAQPAQPSSKYEELIGAPTTHKTRPTQAANPAAPARTQHQPVFVTEKQPYPPTVPSQNPRKPYPSRQYGAGSGRVVDTNFYAPDRTAPTASATAPSSVRTNPTSTPSVSWENNAAMQEERAARILSPFSRASLQERDRRNAQWAKLSAAIDRAVFQALMPKTKKEVLLEKYAAKPAQTTPADPMMQSSGLTGAFAPVGQALAVQKQEIMKNFGSSFGGNAAKQAGSLMDAFARELGSALNTPGLTQAQAAQRVQKISKKYQDKMNELAEQKQTDKFMADRLAQDNQQKGALHNLYPDGQLNEQINGYIDAASQQIRELVAQRDLPAEEQSARYVQIEQEKRENIQKAIVNSGQSLNPFYQWENKQAEADLANLKTKIENGDVESIARVATPKETNTMQENLKVQRQGLEKGLLADPRFGQQAVDEVKPILDNYEAQLKQLYTTELPPDERQTQEIELLKTVNRELLQKRMEQVERMDIPDAQKQQALDELRQAYNNIK